MCVRVYLQVSAMWELDSGRRYKLGVGLFVVQTRNHRLYQLDYYQGGA